MWCQSIARSTCWKMERQAMYVCSFSRTYKQSKSTLVVQLAINLQNLIQYALSSIQSSFLQYSIPPTLLSLPSHLPHLPLPMSFPEARSPPLFAPIIPLMTPLPRPLSTQLRSQGLNARPITWPTVPKGKDRVRICLHARNTREDVDRLVGEIVKWAKVQMDAEQLTQVIDGGLHDVTIPAAKL